MYCRCNVLPVSVYLTELLSLKTGSNTLHGEGGRCQNMGGWGHRMLPSSIALFCHRMLTDLSIASPHVQAAFALLVWVLGLPLLVSVALAFVLRPPRFRWAARSPISYPFSRTSNLVEGHSELRCEHQSHLPPEACTHCCRDPEPTPPEALYGRLSIKLIEQSAIREIMHASAKRPAASG